MCRWYCTSTGPNTNLQCLWCGVYYCGACLHGEYGKMKSLVRCAHCNKNPRSLPDRMRGNWKTLSMETYDPRVVNARRTIQENRNEQVKVDLRHQRRMSGGTRYDTTSIKKNITTSSKICHGNSLFI